MKSVSEIFQCLLVLTAIFATASNALLCTTCLDSTSCRNTPQTQECTVDLVSQHHRYLMGFNPTLDVPSSNVFKCYELEMNYQSPQTESTIFVVQKGCTYSSVNFCEGWLNTTTITNCATCDSTDDCNKGQTTATPGDTTTTPAPTSTTPATTSTTPATTSTTPVTTSTTPASTTTTVPGSSTTTTTTVASTTTAAPATSTTTSTGTPVTTASPTSTTPVETTTVKGGVAPIHLGAIVNWFTIAGYVLLHGLIGRW